MTRRLALPLLTAFATLLAACTTPPEETMTTVLTSTVPVPGTTLHVEQRGDGPPLLLVHGAGEDAAMLAGQADALAAAGYRVITYDRRGTGRSGRADWPGSGADQHADDAAALLTELRARPATVLGLSSGGVVALAMAARHPDSVSRVVAWEAPAAGVLPDGPAATAAIMEPVRAHLAERPGDWVGAQALLLTVIIGVPVSATDPAFAAARANAESMVRDDPQITLRPFTAAELAGAPVTVAVGGEPNDLVAAAADALAELTGAAPALVPGVGHEVYLTDPSALAGLVGPAS
jgi:pimeloyl-ACP methyl ester carboxylesterase